MSQEALGNAAGSLFPLAVSKIGEYDRQNRLISPFVNTDGYAVIGEGGVLGYNMFAYCNNVPVNKSDTDGSRPVEVDEDPNRRLVATINPRAPKQTGIGNNNAISTAQETSDLDEFLNKSAQSAWSIITSITLDAGIGAGAYYEGNILGLQGSIGGHHAAIAFHYSFDEGLSVGSFWEVSADIGFAGFTVGPFRGRFNPWWPWLGERDTSPNHTPLYNIAQGKCLLCRRDYRSQPFR